jgi:NADH dehydrogenase [ubiquinone] 1 alpha subcomplex assembly factor 7
MARADNPLGKLIRDQIRADGPLGLAQYMALALGHPRHGYYITRDPLGSAGDFTTAPEISQMFGELIGLWCVDAWQAMGAPAAFRLVELGPGRGTLMADLLRAASLAPAFRAAADIWMVETSPVLSRLQQQTLAPIQPPVQWTDHLARVPDGPALFVANEFFDALPVRQFQMTSTGWRERMVGLDGERLILALAPDGPGAIAADLPRGAPVGAVAELSPESQSLMADLAGRLATVGGAALIIDYGPAESGLGDSVQALKAHAFADVLAQPGEADLTAHVDFARLARAARSAGAQAWGPVGQGEFLQALGIGARAARLAARGGRAAEEVGAALARLTAPEQMGTLFKVLAITHPAHPAPAGFATVATAGDRP